MNIYPRPPGCSTAPYHAFNALRVVGAAYGLADVTYQVQSMVRNNRLDVVASNGVFGDTWDGNRKTLVVVYQFGNGPYRTEFVTEGRTLHVA